MAVIIKVTSTQTLSIANPASASLYPFPPSNRCSSNSGTAPSTSRYSPDPTIELPGVQYCASMTMTVSSKATISMKFSM